MCSPLLSNLKFSGNDAAYGGGLFDEAGSGGQSSPTIENASFTGNHASGAGGGMHNTSEGTGSISNPSIINAVFANNSSDVWGAGMADYATNGGRTNPSLVDVTFSDNHAALGGAGGGGAMINSATNSGQASPTVNRAVFKANTAAGVGGNGGAMVNSTSTSGVASPALTNTVFDSNSAAGTGGAMLNQAYSSGDSSPQMANTTFYNNVALVGGALINSSPDDAGISNPIAYNSIFWANDGTALGDTWRDVGTGASGSMDYSDVEGGCASTDATCGGTTYNVDPGFVNRAGGDLRLQISSPIADAGSNALVPGGITHDLAGALRFIDNPLAPDIGAGTPPLVDLGAYEHQGHLFADVPVVGKEWMEPWIEAFYNAGITTGCGAGPLIYCPENPVTRAAMAVFILRAKYGAGYVPPAATHTFADMPVAGKEWMEPWVDQLCPGGTELYVDAGAAGANTGDSWTDAFTDLQYALNTIRVCGGPSEVWVAAGMYTPDGANPGDNVQAFVIPPGAAVYGGFAGSEADLSERDWSANTTVLSGDMGGDDDGGDADGNHIDEVLHRDRERQQPSRGLDGWHRRGHPFHDCAGWLHCDWGPGGRIRLQG